MEQTSLSYQAESIHEMLEAIDLQYSVLYIYSKINIWEQAGVNAGPAESGYALLCKWCRTRLQKPTDPDLHCLSKYVNLYQQPGSSNLIGWKLEVGLAY